MQEFNSESASGLSNVRNGWKADIIAGITGRSSFPDMNICAVRGQGLGCTGLRMLPDLSPVSGRLDLAFLEVRRMR
jgi:hypothetical protein